MANADEELMGPEMVVNWFSVKSCGPLDRPSPLTRGAIKGLPNKRKEEESSEFS